MSPSLDNTPVALAPAVIFTDNSITFSYQGDMKNQTFSNGTRFNGTGNGLVDVKKIKN